MRKKTYILLLAAMLVYGGTVFAQTDPTVMTINGKSVSRSEFEYSYNKNNTEGVVDKKSVEEYVELFVNYKLKVEAALAVHLDTLPSFQKEFATYRDQQIRPTFVSDAEMEAEARKIYDDYRARVDKGGGLIKPAHILVLIRQKASEEQIQAAKVRIDSIYQVLKNGGDFSKLAKECSDDKNSAKNGGELPWLERGQTLKEFEDQAYALKEGQMSKPFESPAGWHIIMLKGKRDCFPYDSLHSDILRYIGQRGLRDEMAKKRIDSLAKTAPTQTTATEILAKQQQQLEKNDPELRYLIQEYHDGLLLFEISNRTVWEKAQQDEEGLHQFFAKNKKKYRWDEPRYKGIAYHVKDKADIKAVKNAVKGLSFSKWAETLRSTFNNDSILRIRVEKGIFKVGDNGLIDKIVFKTNSNWQPMTDFPFDAVYGKKLNVPEELNDVRSLVISDYQEQLENEWIAELRRVYPVTIDKEALKTVNNH